MSKWVEILKLIPKGIANIDKVAEGFMNDIRLENGTLSEPQVEEITRRRLICKGCPFESDNKENYETQRTDLHCTLCGCPISTKTACLGCACGAEQYNYNNRNNKNIQPEQVRWHPFKQ